MNNSKTSSRIQNLCWIHCNNCYELFSEKELFLLLGCTHVLCRKCCYKGSQPNTIKCNFCKNDANFKRIDKQLEKPYSNLFQPNYYKKTIDEIKYAENFEKKNLKSLSNCLLEQRKYGQRLQEICAKETQENKAMKLKLQQIEQKEKDLIKKMVFLQNTTLFPNDNNFDNMDETVSFPNYWGNVSKHTTPNTIYDVDRNQIIRPTEPPKISQHPRHIPSVSQLSMQSTSTGAGAFGKAYNASKINANDSGISSVNTSQISTYTIGGEQKQKLFRQEPGQVMVLNRSRGPMANSTEIMKQHLFQQNRIPLTMPMTNKFFRSN